MTLNSPELLYNPLESGEKFRPIPETEAEQPWTKEVEKLKKKKLQNKVAFVSVRSDGELEGNALALYPYIKGEKEICAHKLPHDNDAALAMSEAILTSKVIVTDDYVKYLRYFPLRPEQRVIQLWHACGALRSLVSVELISLFLQILLPMHSIILYLSVVNKYVPFMRMPLMLIIRKCRL